MRLSHFARFYFHATVHQPLFLMAVSSWWHIKSGKFSSIKAMLMREQEREREREPKATRHMTTKGQFYCFSTAIKLLFTDRLQRSFRCQIQFSARGRKSYAKTSAKTTKQGGRIRVGTKALCLAHIPSLPTSSAKWNIESESVEKGIKQIKRYTTWALVARLRTLAWGHALPGRLIGWSLSSGRAGVDVWVL